MSTKSSVQEFESYIADLNAQKLSKDATESSYRTALQKLLGGMLKGLTVINEPKKDIFGRPDFILKRSEASIGHIETKDIGDTDLEGRTTNKRQFDRYKEGYENIIFTDYLDFLYYRNGELVNRARLAEPKGEKIVAVKGNFEKFKQLIETFGSARPQKISSSARLAEVMAGKARLMAEVIESALVKNGVNAPLLGQMEAFKEYLLHDITPKEFADLYAQTIAYGMFAARIHNGSSDKFNRKEASELIPKTNPFLRQLFHNIAGFDLDDRIAWIVDDLAEVFGATDIKAVMKGFGRYTEQTDPMIHFYENFLTAYDSALRKKRGVWYTPQPIVKFIVQAVDHLLQKDFGLNDGLADKAKIKEKIEGIGQTEIHRVQILDPALGTGTFLAETMRQIFSKFQNQTGAWQSYVEQHLIPRLNGFEILMAPYTMAHVKLDWFLTETGYMHNSKQRLRVYLTNSLEEYHPDTGTLFAQFLANEAREANRVKRDTPVMVVMGNPPYAVSSSNKGGWINNLLFDYKKGLNERNIQPLSDDYIKFIRYGQYFIEKNGEGILAYISNNSFLDGLIHRQMRKSLLETFDKIYILDLHGNSKKKETAPDESKDENVFNIQQGVSINILVKTAKKTKSKKPTQVFHHDLWGMREEKFNILLKKTLDTLKWKELSFKDDNYFFVPKDFGAKDKYEKGFKLDELFSVNTSGIKTHDDNNLVDFTPFRDNNHEYAYRPFDVRYINYDLKKVQRHRYNVMKHFIKQQNIGLALMRGFTGTNKFSTVFLCSHLTDLNYYGFQTYIFPLYLYSEKDFEPNIRTSNLNSEIIDKLSKTINLEFEPEKTGKRNKFAPIDLLDYIYAVLHSPNYREKYKEFLKIDFPRIPYPADATEFRRLAKLGAELREWHLMEHAELKGIKNLITKYPIDGNHLVAKLRWEPVKEGTSGRVWINEQQYFDKVPLVAWEFYIGGYQPAQKWLKDRKGRTLTDDDITHYQRIIKTLVKTHELQLAIDSSD